MIGDIERQRLATLEAHHKNLSEYAHEHVTNIYDQIFDTDKQIAALEKENRDIAKAVRNMK